MSGALTIDLNNTDEALTLTSQGNGAYVFTTSVGSTFSGTDIAGQLTGTGTNTLTVTSALTLADVVITDSVAGTDVSFGTNTAAYVDNFSITLDVAGASVVTVANATSFTGTAGLNVAAARNIVITADLSTTTGNIVLDADNGVQQTGFFTGVIISGSGVDVTTGGGNITIEGRGGDTSSYQYGVSLEAGAIVRAGNNGGTLGTVSVTGTGGASTSYNYGVNVTGTNSTITSSGGSVTVIGTGGGIVGSSINYGVSVTLAGMISSGGTGTVSVTGTGGASATNNNCGVYVFGPGSKITSLGGAVIVIGTGGSGSTGGSNIGVNVSSGGVISAGLMGTVSVTGTGGSGVSYYSFGVFVAGTDSKIISSGGSVTVNGTGGGGGGTGSNGGVAVISGGVISAGLMGDVLVTGTGGADNGSDNYGVWVFDTDATITSSGGSVTVNGTGGGTGMVSAGNFGVHVNLTGAMISAGGTGTVSVIGTGGVGTGSTGIDLRQGTITTNSSGAAVTLTADSMAFDATSVVSSTGTVTLRNKTAGVNIDLGTETPGQLSLTRSELNRVTAGTLVIGRSDVNPGVITVSDSLTLTPNLQLIGPAGITLKKRVTTTGSQTYTGAVTLGANVPLITTDSNILFSSTLNGARTLNLTAGAGTVTFTGTVGNSIELSALTIISAGDVSIGAAMRVTGAIGITSNSGVNVSLGSATGGLNLSNTELDFIIAAGSLNITAAGAGTMTVNAVSGGGTITGTTTLTAGGTGVTFATAASLFNNALTVASAAIIAGVNITTTGDAVIFSSTVTLTTGQSAIDTTNAGGAVPGSSITFGAGITDGISSFDLNLNAGTNGAITGTSVNINNLTITNGASAAFTDAVTVNDLITTTTATATTISMTGTGNIFVADVEFLNTGAVTFGNGNDTFTFTGGLNVTTPSSVSISGTVATTDTLMTLGDVDTGVILGANTILNAGMGSINLPGTVSNFGAGAFSLTPITSGAGLTTISGPNTNTTTNVTTGVVQINNTTASTTNFAVSGGTLKGTGSIGNLTGTGTGIIAPGNSPGLVTTTNLSLTSTNTLQIEINNVSPPVAGTDYDQIVVSSGGTVALGLSLIHISEPTRPY